MPSCTQWSLWERTWASFWRRTGTYFAAFIYVHACTHASIHPSIHTYIHPSIHPYIHTYRVMNFHPYLRMSRSKKCIEVPHEFPLLTFFLSLTAFGHVGHVQELVNAGYSWRWAFVGQAIAFGGSALLCLAYGGRSLPGAVVIGT